MTYVQDAVGVGSLGPSVRVDLGQVVPANQPVTLRFRWSGALLSPEGGPLATKRLAYVGPEGSYLMYASRWFPFHDYAADRATSDITLIVPTGLQVAGTSDGITMLNPSVPAKLTVRIGKIDTFCFAWGTVRTNYAFAPSLSKACEWIRRNDGTSGFAGPNNAMARR
mgnify:CR=1 FL=1